jgi:hypothetical protein
VAQAAADPYRKNFLTPLHCPVFYDDFFVSFGRIAEGEAVELAESNGLVVGADGGGEGMVCW